MLPVATRKKPTPEPFDVGDFLRPTDTDLRSALNSLLHGQAIGPEAMEEPGVKLEPALELTEESSFGTPPITPEAGLTLAAATITGAGSGPTRARTLVPGLSLTPPPELAPTPNSAITVLSPEPNSPPLSIVRPGINTAGEAFPTPPLTLSPGPLKRQFAVRPAHLVEDGHSRAEQQVYQSLWDNATPHDDISRLITLGFASLGKLAGLSESNARINLRSLLQKLALDEHTTYNCATSQGRTYRIYHPAEVLRRRDAAGLRWVMRRTLAVVFVDPQTKLPLFTKTGSHLTPGPKLSTSLVVLNAIRGQLQQYGPVDSPTVQAFLDTCQQRDATLTAESLATLIHEHAHLSHGDPPAERIRFLLTAIPENLG